MNTIEGKVALVTGAAHGIGAAIAEWLARAGARVAITYRQDEAGANELVNKCRTAGLDMRAYQVSELADDVQTAKLFAVVLKDFGRFGYRGCQRQRRRK